MILGPDGKCVSPRFDETIFERLFRDFPPAPLKIERYVSRLVGPDGRQLSENWPKTGVTINVKKPKRYDRPDHAILAESAVEQPPMGCKV